MSDVFGSVVSSRLRGLIVWRQWRMMSRAGRHFPSEKHAAAQAAISDTVSVCSFHVDAACIEAARWWQCCCGQNEIPPAVSGLTLELDAVMQRQVSGGDAVKGFTSADCLLTLLKRSKGNYGLHVNISRSAEMLFWGNIRKIKDFSERDIQDLLFFQIWGSYISTLSHNSGLM